MRAQTLRLQLTLVLLVVAVVSLPLRAALNSGEAHVWDVQEITFEASQDYENPYADVELWVQLEGPGFSKRVYGFWDGGRNYKVRFVTTTPGEWKWTSASNQPNDTGLSQGKGQLRAVAWSEAELQENPNRRGFLRNTSNGHALQYADGTPFLLIGDTWLAASTWRLPFKGTAAVADREPGPGLSFEDAVAYRKRQGYNSVSLIAAFPNWAADAHGATYANRDGVYLRNAWEKFGVWAPNASISTADGATTTAKDMHDEQGHRPFQVFADREGLANFDRLVPEYFQSLDRKMRHLSDEGFAPFLEPVRRDHGPAWKTYFDFNRSYGRFIQYLIARYGAYNLIFSGIHLDWIPEKYSLTADEFNAALIQQRKTYGAPPFGQPFTTLIDSSTYQRFGHGDRCPWLNFHTVGNKPRNHAIYASIEEIFRLPNPYPVANLEPYYTGWNHSINRPGGETPPANSDRDNYFARAMMYGSVLSGGLAGHVHGTAAYDVTSTGEPAGWRPPIWEALRYASGAQMQHLKTFVLAEGSRYQDLQLANSDLSPRSAPKASADGLDGWSHLMRTADGTLALAYFELDAPRSTVSGLMPERQYHWRWYNPRTGEWATPITLMASQQGTVAAPPFPGSADNTARQDWAAAIKVQ